MDILNQQIKEYEKQQDEYNNYLNNTIEEYYMNIKTDFPVQWDPINQKYIQVENLRDALRLDELNEVIEE